MKTKKLIWIKTLLHKDRTPQWDGVTVDKVNAKIKELEDQGYNPIIDHKFN